ncbi:MAG: hypothetical protein CBB71_07000 [Rhodopirellula sp. TMED11]|nr:MAG: hypothetical protein CBB71_07000 [Rhodopirellula sp. TMED11]
MGNQPIYHAHGPLFRAICGNATQRRRKTTIRSRLGLFSMNWLVSRLFFSLQPASASLQPASENQASGLVPSPPSNTAVSIRIRYDDPSGFWVQPPAALIPSPFFPPVWPRFAERPLGAINHETNVDRSPCGFPADYPSACQCAG